MYVDNLDENDDSAHHQGYKKRREVSRSQLVAVALPSVGQALRIVLMTMLLMLTVMMMMTMLMMTMMTRANMNMYSQTPMRVKERFGTFESLAEWVFEMYLKIICKQFVNCSKSIC